ncbi:unnamed protein product [Symbiodinium natans]|uniref:Uncharacterized protein n=1 Tax=Symbiodinium natans TaxID=878477 RepID=A0A812IIS2_9DINO|nr:unnamed protein product [Symbiodinium natans]
MVPDSGRFTRCPAERRSMGVLAEPGSRARWACLSVGTIRYTNLLQSKHARLASHKWEACATGAARTADCKANPPLGGRERVAAFKLFCWTCFQGSSAIWLCVGRGGLQATTATVGHR